MKKDLQGMFNRFAKVKKSEVQDDDALAASILQPEELYDTPEKFLESIT